MKTTIRISALLLLTVVYCGTLKAQTNFSGSYSLDKQKTDFGPAPQWILPQSYTITQQGSAITIIRAMLDPQMQSHRDTLQLRADGSTFQNSSYSGKRQSFILTWAADKKSFTVTLHSVTPDGQPFANSTETWSLDDSGKLLLAERSVEQVSNGSKYTLKGYYDKK